MTRFIEIHNEKNIQLLNSDDLPFVVSLYNQNTSDGFKEQYLKVRSIENIEEQSESIDCAYIAEDEGHLYFQPETSQVKLFHNDELIEKSVWIKSGDFIQINNKIISFKISGDRIEIRIRDRKKSSVLSPPPREELLKKADIASKIHKNKETVQENLHQKDIVQKNLSANKTSSFKKMNYIVLTILILLITLASFILLAKTVSINIQTEPDKIQLSGILPTVKIGERYLVLSGEYRLQAEKKGFKPLNELLKINSENTSFSFVMTETPGIVELNVKSDNNNTIYINDVLLGNSNAQNNTVSFELEKGQHRLKITNPRYKVLEQLIHIEGKNILQRFDIELKPNWGIVKIPDKPRSTQVIIHSKKTNKVINEKKMIPPAEIELITGEYEIKFIKEKFKSRTINISINAQQVLEIDPFELEPEDALVHITSKPANSIIRIDEKYYGKAPQTIKISSYKKHKIEVSSTGYTTKTENIELEAEQEKALEVLLKAKNSDIFITSSPKQAQLYIDGKLQKKSSGKFKLNSSNHTFKVQAKGYKSQTKKINMSSYSKNISFHLEKLLTEKKSTQTINSNPIAGKKLSKKNNKNKSMNYINSIDLKMIRLDKNTFMMGSPRNEIGRRSNEQQHKVTISYPFYLSEKEITNEQFRQFNASHNSGMSAGVKSGNTLDSNERPVVNVSWNDAAKFTNWLSKKEGLTLFYKEQNGKMKPVNLKGTINGYRLPFEAEWSYAARANRQNKYPWTGSFPPAPMSGNFSDESARTQVSVVIENYDDKHSVSAPVGSYKKNPFGFYDMGGNVSEWCQDFYSPNAFSTKKNILLNPTGPENGVHKVVRDSSWRDASITELRMSYRNYSKKAAHDIGFRIARYAQ